MTTLSDIKSTLAGADIIDVRDLIAAVEQLEEDLADLSEQEADRETVSDEWHDMHCLRLDYMAILDELRGEGGDEQWRGGWYPGTLIHDRYFADYARELVEDCGDIPRDLPHYIEVDWDATARNIRSDYTCIDIDGNTYWYR